MTKSVYMETYGCQMNDLDSEILLGNLLKQNYKRANTIHDSDIIIFNTCSVREHAEERVISRVGKLKYLKRKRPDVVIAVVGCMAQNKKSELIERIPHIDIVCGTFELGKLTELIEKVYSTRKQPPHSTFTKYEIAVSKEKISPLEYVRPPSNNGNVFQRYVKAMEGCNMKCSFCIVPFVRGRVVSRPINEIFEETKKITDDGVVEITLLGHTINSYGLDLNPRKKLSDLLEKLHIIPNLKRIRFITSHPSFMDDDIIESVASLPKVCKYIHIPAQSGSDKILKLMKRGYDLNKYKNILTKFREKIPNVEFSSDFIVGFPGETADDFEKTVQLIDEVKYQNIFVFKYSPRPNTEAFSHTDNVPIETKKVRNNILLDLQKRISFEQNKKLINRTLEILVEGRSKKNPLRQMGRTQQNNIVVFEHEKDLKGQFVDVVIENVSSLTLFGRLKDGKN